jgi:hypothetical protein
MKKLLTAALLTLGVPAFAQTPQSLSELGCNTVSTPAELQEIYDWAATYTASASKSTGVVDTIPLSIHIVGNDNGTGYYRLENLFTVLCNLNNHYKPSEFYFAVKWPIHYINNSDYYIHNNQSGFAMMSQHKVANTANVFFVEDPAGACGYFSPSPDCIAIRKSCASVTSTTLTHELGHYLSLPHTCNGWEHGNTPSNPEKVTRGIGANCSTTGDGFCDTEADYLAERWNCPYTGNMLDQTGTPYHPDSSIYMSYATDNCMTRFSPMEMARMKTRYGQRKNNLPMTGISSYSEMSVPNVIYPTNLLYANEKRIIWSAVPGADYYFVRITSTISNNLVYQELLTAGTQMNVTFNAVLGGSYTVHIAPLNSRNLCRSKTRVMTFTTTDATINGLGIGGASGNDETVTIAPNPVRAGSALNITVKEGIKGNIDILNMAGQVLSSVASTTSGTVSMNIGNWPSGMYVVRYSTATGTVRQKLIVQ